MELIRSVKGMNDLLPADSRRWQHIEDTARRVFERYGFREVRTPIVEETRLFARGIGELTDIVEKEMYTFADRNGTMLTLRPENTAGVVRALIEHNLLALDRAQKLYYLGPMFRYERPQKGRYRQFFQIGAEVFGLSDALADAEVIAMACRFLSELGLAELEVRINSLGDVASREAYRNTLIEALRPHHGELCKDCQRRYEQNPLRVLDCKVPGCKAIAATLPVITDSLGEADRAHFDGLQEALTDLGINFKVDAHLVRGLDYYTRTIFEVVATSSMLGAQNTVVGGGRYDGLVEQLGGPATPAIGFAFGVERLALLLEGAALPEPARVFVAAMGNPARRWAARTVEALRRVGVHAELDTEPKSLKAQLRRADRITARLCIIVGDGELERGMAQMKDMVAGGQREVPFADVVSAVQVVLQGMGA